MPIAIVIVTLNVLGELRRTIESLAGLQDPRVTVLVVDGASRDGTPDYLKSLPPERVRWISEPDRGIYDAMNKGWNLVPPDAWVLYLGAGDTVRSLPTADTLARCDAEGEHLVIGRCRMGQGFHVSRWTPDIRYGNTVHHQALLLRRSVAGESPFDDTLRVYGDWDFNLRLYCRSLRARFDDSFTSEAMPGGISATICLPEIWRVALRHGGLRGGAKAYLMNVDAKWRIVLRNRLRGLRGVYGR
ncbi:MAG: glycosyltransferase [Rhizobiales bacterium]|nr:glycosyltransferase [Rhizobacter sp.]